MKNNISLRKYLKRINQIPTYNEPSTYNQRMEWIKKEINDVTTELRHPDININRYNFLVNVKNIMDKIINGQYDMTHQKFDDNIYIIAWYIDVNYRKYLHFEMSPKEELIIIEYIQSNESTLIATLFNIMNKVRSSNIFLGNIITMIIDIDNIT